MIFVAGEAIDDLKQFSLLQTVLAEGADLLLRSVESRGLPDSRNRALLVVVLAAARRGVFSGLRRRGGRWCSRAALEIFCRVGARKKGWCGGREG